MRHIVVVDDSLQTLRVTSAMIANIEDVVVHPFALASEALTWATHNTVDAFVLADDAASSNDAEVVRSLRAAGRFAHVPLIVTSSRGDIEVRLTVLRAGANDVLEQPVEPRELIARLQSLLSLHDARAREADRVKLLEEWLRQDQMRLRRQADRFASLWRIASVAGFSERDLIQEMLDQSTVVLREGQLFIGSLSRLDGDAIVVEARAFDPEAFQPTQAVPVGTRIPLGDALQQLVIEQGCTRSWDDVETDPVASNIARVRTAGCRALICTPFAVGRTTYFLTFWSRTPVIEPFGSDDDNYVELVAAFFAVRLQQSRKPKRPPVDLPLDA
jgi:DNA-binding response OmpR family regulator